MTDNGRGTGARQRRTHGDAAAAGVAGGSGVLTRYRGPLTISVALAAGLYLVGIWLSDGQAVLARLSRLPAWLVGAALILPTLGFFSRFWRWDIFLRSLGHRLPFFEHLRIYMSGFALTTTPGKVGENVRAMYLTSFGVPVSDSVAAFVVERLGDVLAMLLLSSLVIRLLGGYEWVIGLTAGSPVSCSCGPCGTPACPPSSRRGRRMADGSGAR